MKYDDKYSAELDRAKRIIKDIVDDKGDLKLNSEEKYLGSVLNNLNKFFRGIGVMNSDLNDAPEKGNYPRSSRINRLIKDLSKDIFELYGEQEALEFEITKSENIAKAQRESLTILREIAMTKVFNGPTHTVSNDSSQYWFSDYFKSNSNVDLSEGKTDNSNMFDSNEGIITLEYAEEQKIPILFLYVADRELAP